MSLSERANETLKRAYQNRAALQIEQKHILLKKLWDLVYAWLEAQVIWHPINSEMDPIVMKLSENTIRRTARKDSFLYPYAHRIDMGEFAQWIRDTHGVKVTRDFSEGALNFEVSDA